MARGEAVDGEQWVVDGDLRCTDDLTVGGEVGDFGEQQWHEGSSMVASVEREGLWRWLAMASYAAQRLSVIEGELGCVRRQNSGCKRRRGCWEFI